MVERDPLVLGHQRARWTLSTLRESLPWLRLTCDSALHRVLERLDIVYKRARRYIRSPDRLYQEKKHYIEARKAEVEAAHRSGSGRLVLLYQDEMSYYRQPSLARAYAERGCGGRHQALAFESHRSNTRARLVGCLNALTGQVHFRQRSKIGVVQLVAFYQELAAAYPEAETIYVVQDNWPVHFHPGVVKHLARQDWPWPFRAHPDWPQPAQVVREAVVLPIQLLCLPTYASWLNPIEKLWRWLRQEVLHLHRLSDAWAELKQRVEAFLEQFIDGSQALLRYVGLLPD